MVEEDGRWARQEQERRRDDPTTCVSAVRAMRPNIAVHEVTKGDGLTVGGSK